MQEVAVQEEVVGREFAAVRMQSAQYLRSFLSLSLFFWSTFALISSDKWNKTI